MGSDADDALRRCDGRAPELESAEFAVETMRKVLFGLALFAGTIDLLNHFVFSVLDAQVSPWPAVFRTLVFWVSYIPMLALALLLVDRYRLDLANSRRNLFIHLLAALGFAYVHTACQSLLLDSSPWISTASPSLPRLFRIVRVNFPIDFVSYWAIVGATYAFHYHTESHQRELTEARLKTTAAELEARLAEARLQALRSQLNPHFLFNTLNAVSALALKGEAKAVARTLSRLSGLLRTLLDDEGSQFTSLAKELDFLNSYLEIQRLLFGERLALRRNIAPDTVDAVIPSMVLQPLVENALVHGISKSSDLGQVGIEAAREDGMLRLTVTDSGGGFASVRAPRKGIGLSNTEARLKQLYGIRHSIEYGQTKDGGAMVVLHIPFVNGLPDAASA
jgi:two-component system, LytTR family, sensor kinase